MVNTPDGENPATTISPVTMSGPVTHVPVTIMTSTYDRTPVTTTVTTVTYTCVNPTMTASQHRLISSLEDSRMGWMTRQNPMELGEANKQPSLPQGFHSAYADEFAQIREMMGSVRHALASLAQTSKSPEVTRPEKLNQAAASSLVPPILHVPVAPQNLLEVELLNTREMLGLSPNADSRMVQRTIADLVKNSRPHREEVFQNQDVPWPSVPKPRMGTVEQNLRPATLTGGPMPTPQVNTHYVPPNYAFQTPYHEYDNRNHPRVPITFGHSREGTSSRDFSSLCDSVRKWNLRFDGRRDPVSFLERLEELIEAYAVSPDDVLKTMPEFLQGSALLWYRNMRDAWNSFDEFKRYFETQFLPPGYRRNLDQEIRKRTQGETEPFRDFVVALSTLIRRSGTLSNHQKLELIYANMRPEYKLMVRRQDFGTLHELIERAEEFEAYERDRRSFRPPPPPSQALVTETAYIHRRKSDKPLDLAVVDDECTLNHSTKQTSNWASPSLQVAPRRKSGDQEKSNRQTDSFCGVRQPAKTSSTSSRPKSPPPDRKRNPITCWNCDKLGHSFSECQLPKVLRCYYCKREGVATVHCRCRSRKTQCPTRLLSSEATGVETIKTFADICDQQGKEDDRPFVDITLFGRTFRALVDTGAMTTLIGDQVRGHLQLNGVAPEILETNLRMVDGTTSSSQHKYHCAAEIAGRHWPMTAFYVPRLSTDVILGMKDIKYLNLIQFNVGVELCH